VTEFNIALIGDYDATVTAHRAIPRALALAGAELGVSVHPLWTHTMRITKASSLAGADAVWCVPASPYANTQGALAAIRHARETGLPFLGTCGGFQHALLEVAQAVWGIESPAHAELDPLALDPVVAPLSCSLVEARGAIHFAPGSRIALAYGATEAGEEYHCSYGFNSHYLPRLMAGPLRATGRDAAGEVRAVELDGHPFFVATLFQPERAALAGRTPHLVRAFLQAIH
jgi:CTP synthase (UTP-ammonia lyase)